MANVSGGVPPYTYLWSGGETTGSLVSRPGHVFRYGDGLRWHPSQRKWNSAAGELSAPDHMDTFILSRSGLSYRIRSVLSSGHYGGGWPMDNIHRNDEVAEVPIPEVPGHLYLDLGQMTPGAAFDVTYWDVNGCPGSISGTVGDPILS